MSELSEVHNLLIAYKAKFARKKNYKEPQDWYPNSSKDLEDLLSDFIIFEPDAKKFEKELKFKLDSSHAQVLEEDLSLKASDKDRNHQAWLFDNRKIWINANNTNSQFAFFKSKIEQNLGAAFKSLDLSTDRTLEDLEDPKRLGNWDTKAMVIGDVQSGKTSDYNGLIAKAIDTGYKVVIVLAGTLDSLRAQTQTRLENTLISTQQNGECTKALFLTKKPEYIIQDGVRKIYRSNDFNTATASSTGLAEEDVTVIVCKKHVSVMASILIWLGNQNIKSNEKIDWTWEKGWSSYVKQKLPTNPVECKLPLLLIDDECDNASLDISTRKMKIDEMSEEEKIHFRETDPSKTNMLLRRILKCFNRNAYIGYTATPLANIMINHESYKNKDGMDIFPEDFVKLLPRHPEYIGLSRIFGKADRNFNEDDEAVSLSEDLKEEDSPNVEWIWDYRDDFDKFPDLDTEEGRNARDKKYREEANSKEDINGWMPLYHKNGHLPYFNKVRSLPDSLKKAVKLFLINIALRYYRTNIDENNSMLVHVSRFTSVQKEVEKQISEYLKDLINTISLSLDEKDKMILKDSFKILWTDEILKKTDSQKFPNTKNIEFENIWKKISVSLCDESNPIDVLQMNSTSDDSLDYESKEKEGKNWNIIVVGGAAVSRGITLDGLSVSYFSRLAKKPTSDTLIQMGRWFGYRKGYEDSFRVFCPKTLHILFRQFSFTYDKARDHFVELSSPPAKSPKDYAFEIPCFDGWNIVSKSKGKDITIVKEPFLSFLSKSHTPIQYFKDSRRQTNNDLIDELVSSLPKNFETQEEINDRLEKGKIWLPLRTNTHISKELSQQEIINKISKDVKPRITEAYLWKNIDSDVLINYFSRYQSLRDLNDWTPKILAAKLLALKKSKNFKWNIAIFGKQDKKEKSEKYNFAKGIETTIINRTVNYDDELAKVGTLSDPRADFLDLDEKTFNNGIESWISLYKKTGKVTFQSNNLLQKRASNYAPANFKEKIRKYKKNGLFIIYPFTSFKKEEKEIYFGWQLIIPPTRDIDDDEKLIYNQALNLAAVEHRRAEIDSILRTAQE